MTLLGNIQLKHIGNLTTPKTQGRAVVSSIQPATHLNWKPRPYIKAKLGRRRSRKTAQAYYILDRTPNLTPRQLRIQLLVTYNTTITPSHAWHLIKRYHKYQQRYTQYLSKVNNFNDNNTIRHFHGSQLSTDIVLDSIERYINVKTMLNREFIDNLLSVFNGNCVNLYPKYRYDGDYTLRPTDSNYRVRKCIQRLRDKTTPISEGHAHYHNNKLQVIRFHIQDLDLCKYLCNLLGLEYRSRIYIGKGHFISTDSSGLDICHLGCLEQLLDTSIQTQLEGTHLLKKAFSHGKLLGGNQVVTTW